MSGLKHQNSTSTLKNMDFMLQSGWLFYFNVPKYEQPTVLGRKILTHCPLPKRSIRHDAGCNLMAQAVHGTCAGSGWTTPLTSYDLVKVTWFRLKLKLIRITGWRLCWKHEPVWVCVVRVGQMSVSWVCHGIGNPGNLPNLERIPIQCLGLALCRGHHPT